MCHTRPQLSQPPYTNGQDKRIHPIAEITEAFHSITLIK